MRHSGRARGLATLLVALAIGLSFSLPAWGASDQPAGAKEPIKIGAILPLTGPWAQRGLWQLLMISHLEEKINSLGGIAGRKIQILGPSKPAPNPKGLGERGGCVVNKDNRLIGANLGKGYRAYDQALVLNELDQGGKPVLSNLPELVKLGAIAVLGPSSSGATMALVPLAEQQQTTMISFGEHDDIVKPVKKWVFKTTQSYANKADFCMQYLQKKGVKKVAFLGETGPFGGMIFTNAQEAARKAGLELVAEVRVPAGDPLLAADWEKIEKSGAGGLFIGLPRKVGDFSAARKKLPNMIWLDFFPNYNPASFRVGPPGLTGPVSLPLVYRFLDKNSPEFTLVDRFYRTLQHMSPPSAHIVGIMAAYDGLNLLKAALESLAAMKKQVDRQNVRMVLEGIRGYQGISGIYNFSPQDHNGLGREGYWLVDFAK